ncbi:MAG: glycosyltransferase family 2 protein [Candidatus Eremiobacterota bacterium]
MNAPDLSLVVPVYNEEDNLLPLYRQVAGAMEGLGKTWELVLVDDGSRDGSLARMESLAAEDPRVVVVSLRRNFGQTAAMAAGFDHARAAVVVTLDADLQNDPADIGKLLPCIEQGYDVVSGWRRKRQDAFASRTLPSRIANSLISWITGVHLHDYGCTLKAYRREVLERLRLYGEMHRFLPALLAQQGARIVEVEVGHHPRLHGTSKYGLNRTFKVVLDLITVKFLGSYGTKPIYVFGTLGLLLCASGLAAGLRMIYLKLVRGISMILTPYPVLTAMLLILGAQCLLMGLLAELIVRTYHESQGKQIYVLRRVTRREG